MSNYKAIATVTAVIRDILAKSQENIADSNVYVKTSPPTAIKEVDNDILNLFLYQVTSNSVGHSLDLPTRSHDGKLMAKPLLALDLHYLLTTSSKNELKAQLMLSSAMVALQENAIISKNKIVETILNSQNNDEAFLIESNLANQVESLKISLQSLTIEELTKLWSSFFQTGYRLSVAYHVSVVLLESSLELTPSLPVSKRQLHVIPINQPIIEKIEPQMMTYDPQKRLTINGRHLNSDKVFVRISDKDIEIKDAKYLSENSISLIIPEDTSAGVKQVQIIQKLFFENDKTGHKGHTSNIAAFVLTPNLNTVTPTSLTSGEALTLNFEPGIAENQKVNVLIGDYVVTVNLPPASPTVIYPLKTLTITIPSHIITGTYPVRLRVNNAESSLKNDNSQIITITTPSNNNNNDNTE